MVGTKLWTDQRRGRSAGWSNHRLEVIGEGVETASQRERLRDFACGSMQGFLVSHPLTPEAAGALLAER